MKIYLFLFGFFFLSLMVTAQPVIENLVFEGAGIRGLAYAGAVNVLENKGILKNVKRVGGTSAGAITALMLSLGYSATEIQTIIGETNFKSFNDGHWAFLGGLNRLRKGLGWYPGKKFEQWLAHIIKGKTGNENITFGGLHAQGYKDLYVTGSNLTTQRLEIFSAEAYPLMKIKDAVRISMSIPLYFQPLWMDASGNIVRNPKNKAGLNILMDGGIIGNFPIKIFDSTQYMNSPEKAFAINLKTAGFRIDSDSQIQKDKSTGGLKPMPVTNIKEYMSAFYVMVIENLNRQTLTPSDWQRTVSISDGNIGPRIRKLKKAEIDTLVFNGQSATEIYFDKIGLETKQAKSKN